MGGIPPPVKRVLPRPVPKAVRVTSAKSSKKKAKTNKMRKTQSSTLSDINFMSKIDDDSINKFEELPQVVLKGSKMDMGMSNTSNEKKRGRAKAANDSDGPQFLDEHVDPWKGWVNMDHPKIREQKRKMITDMHGDQDGATQQGDNGERLISENDPNLDEFIVPTCESYYTPVEPPEASSSQSKSPRSAKKASNQSERLSDDLEAKPQKEMITVKVRTRTGAQEVRMQEDAPMKRVWDAIQPGMIATWKHERKAMGNALGEPPKIMLLMPNERRLTLADTPLSVGYKTGDVLVAHFDMGHQAKVVQAPAKPQEKSICIQVRIKDGDVLKFGCVPSDQFAKLYEAVAKKQGIQVKDLKLMFDGETVPPAETMKGADMEDEDVVDAYFTMPNN